MLYIVHHFPKRRVVPFKLQAELALRIAAVVVTILRLVSTVVYESIAKNSKSTHECSAFPSSVSQLPKTAAMVVRTDITTVARTYLPKRE